MRVGRKITRCVALRLVACLLLVRGTMLAYAQDEIDTSIPTLKVYTNLLQIPTLVLDDQRRPIANIAENRFRVSIDGGPRSRVTHVRAEGDDPIALSILVDLANTPAATRSRLVDAIVGLGRDSLRSPDTVFLYSLDCQLARSIVPSPTTPATLREAAELLFGSSKPHDAAACRQRWNLLDAIVSAVQAIQEEPTRRVLLVLSDGEDRGSRTSWDAARLYASMNGVAVFASIPYQPAVLPFAASPRVMGVQSVPAPTNLPSLCDATGGVALDTKDTAISVQMRNLVALVRKRYIVEFPRPAADPGNHSMEITVEKLSASIHPAGATVPLPDPELSKDPNTILMGPDGAPEVGTKRPQQ